MTRPGFELPMTFFCTLIQGWRFVLPFTLLLVGGVNGTVQARTVEGGAAVVHIRVQSLEPARVIVEGTLGAATQTWSFRKTYAALMTLGERIDGLRLADQTNKQVEVRRLGPGEYRAEAPAIRFRYEVRLDPPARADDSTYASWLTPARGLLMLGDLLPGSAPSDSGTKLASSVTLELPSSWLVSSVEKRMSATAFEVPDSENAVFLVGKDLQQVSDRVRGMEFTLAASGQWAFSSAELLALAKSIIETHATSLGSVPVDRAFLLLTPFPRPEGPHRWSAEARGRTVVLLSGVQPSKTAALVQLSTPLSHELFHLWIPNGLELDGDYAWFYEGFTIYQSLRAAQQLNLLTFQDFLNAVARAFDSYSAVPGRDQLSLVEASQRRWTTSPALIYQKAMLVAFLYDLTLRSRTSNKRSLEDVYKELFRRHRAGAPREQGNGAVIRALSSLPGMHEFAKTYVQSPAAIDLSTWLPRFGLSVEKFGLRTRITVANSLSREQRDLLRRLGYNAETRRTGR